MSRKNSIIFFVCLVFFITSFIFLFVYLVKNDAKKDTSFDDKIKSAMAKSNTASVAEVQPKTQQAQQTTANAAAQEVPESTASTPAAESTEVNNNAEVADAGVEEKKTFTSETLKISLEYSDQDLKFEEGTNMLTISKDDKECKLRFYKDSKKKDIEDWYKDHYKSSDNPSCTFAEPTIKLGTLTAKLIKADSSFDKCEDGGNLAASSDNSRKVRINPGKFSTDEVNKFLADFKFD